MDRDQQGMGLTEISKICGLVLDLLVDGEGT